MIVAEVIEWFLRNDTNRKSALSKSDAARIIRLFGAMHGTRKVETCSPQDLVDFLDARLVGGSQWTRQRWNSTIKRVFNEAARLGVISCNPFAGVMERQGKRRRPMTWEELRSLLRMASPPLRWILMAVRFTGATPGELRTIQWPDVDLDGGQMTVKRHPAAPARTIQLSPQMAGLLRWLKRHRPAVQSVREERDDVSPCRHCGHKRAHTAGCTRRQPSTRVYNRHLSPYVFLNKNKSGWRADSLARYLRVLRRRAGLASDVTLFGAACLHRAERKAERAARKLQELRQRRQRRRRARPARPARVSPDVRLNALLAKIESMAAAPAVA